MPLRESTTSAAPSSSCSGRASESECATVPRNTVKRAAVAEEEAAEDAEAEDVAFRGVDLGAERRERAKRSAVAATATAPAESATRDSDDDSEGGDDALDM